MSWTLFRFFLGRQLISASGELRSFLLCCFYLLRVTAAIPGATKHIEDYSSTHTLIHYRPGEADMGVEIGCNSQRDHRGGTRTEVCEWGGKVAKGALS